jgi:hypothetical protein
MVKDAVDTNNRRFISSVKASRAQAWDYDFCNLQCSAALTDIDPNLHDGHLLRTLESNVKVSSTATGKRRGNLMAEWLAKKWSISVDSVKQTLKSQLNEEPELPRTQACQGDFGWTIVSHGAAGCSVTCALTPLMPRLQGQCEAMSMLRSLQQDLDGVVAPFQSKLWVGSAWSGFYPICTRWRAKCNGDGWSQRTDSRQLQEEVPWGKLPHETDGASFPVDEHSGKWHPRAQEGIDQADAKEALTHKRSWDDCLEFQGQAASNAASNHFGLNGETPEKCSQERQPTFLSSQSTDGAIRSSSGTLPFHTRRASSF